MNLSRTALFSRVCSLGALSLLLSATAHAQFTLTGTVRDFLYAGTAAGTYNGNAGVGHPDFESFLGDDHGIVTSTLGVDGKPVYATRPAGTATTTGAAAFNQWYNDTPGVNVSLSTSLLFNPIGGGLFEYNNSSFFPIDGLGFGNQSGGHNFAFTFELHTTFTYQTGQVFDFTGDDDVWVYINNNRVIDLGGVHGPESASVNLDTLGLIAGNNYKLDFFSAERHTSGSNIKITTNISLTPSSVTPELPGAMQLLPALLPVALIGARKRFKKA
ncbi:fibro-slime domain-containing protein [Armatimonas rosea]|uniref:Fibro-slime domain-containing protein n=1 Tax=Armatimonas rosea TaxID=685828 RepID=A0A7W9SSN2_ARMRO|nr:fibro-slime domain-containing protein [Armatimonas rosea]MBB6051518.1 fibro-slime domain-containing protein [Armatimonas rosea]